MNQQSTYGTTGNAIVLAALVAGLFKYGSEMRGATYRSGPFETNGDDQLVTSANPTSDEDRNIR